MVILAAGLDSRSWRLAWPDGTTVYELDQPGCWSSNPRPWPRTARSRPATGSPSRWICARTGQRRCGRRFRRLSAQRMVGRGADAVFAGGAQDLLFDRVQGSPSPAAGSPSRR
ncbi:leucine carboxyl methyltransferase family protein [Mycobacterium xenopi 4042]|uniref:Leucine carboxyl methyltransferase family protein n=1 Tax=Mycobacterium xenopi 4042 TaxID=1299334 RepID=X8C7Y3_MYCXE|nr:leucine carboxyl methyltransferase family protein [Mycobacterium xenopi 4042]